MKNKVEIKQVFFFFEKKIKMAESKKGHFPAPKQIFGPSYFVRALEWSNLGNFFMKNAFLI